MLCFVILEKKSCIYLQTKKVLGQVINAAAAPTLPILASVLKVKDTMVTKQVEMKDMLVNLDFDNLNSYQNKSVLEPVEMERNTF